MHIRIPGSNLPGVCTSCTTNAGDAITNGILQSSGRAGATQGGAICRAQDPDCGGAVAPEMKFALFQTMTMTTDPSSEV